MRPKFWKQQSAWLLVASSETLPDPCPGCGEVADRKAAICRNCRYVYNPLQAYKATLIEHGHISMDRLSSEDWKVVNAIKADRDDAKRRGRKGQKNEGDEVQDTQDCKGSDGTQKVNGHLADQVHVNGKYAP